MIALQYTGTYQNVNNSIISESVRLPVDIPNIKLISFFPSFFCSLSPKSVFVEQRVTLMNICNTQLHTGIWIRYDGWCP